MAMEFDGSSMLTISGFPVPSGTTGIISVSMWWTPTNIAGGLQRLWGSDTNMEARQGENPALDVVLTSDIFEPPGGEFDSTIVLVDDQLYHVVMTGDANTDSGSIYIDGVLDATSITQTGATVGTVMSIGGRTGAVNFAEGFIEDWRAYDRTISAEEVATIFAARGVDGIVEGMIARFMLNEHEPGHVAVASDVKGSGPLQLALTSVTGTPTYAASNLRFRRRAA